MSEFIKNERLAVILDAITGLQEIQRIEGKLSQTGQAALAALQRLLTRGRGNIAAVITHEEMKNPLAAAHRIIERSGVCCGSW